jgi:hypothetical protein
MQILVQVALHWQTLKVQVQAKYHFLVLHQHRTMQARLSHATHPMTICVPELRMYFTFCTAVARPHSMSLVRLHLVQKTNKNVRGILSHMAYTAQKQTDLKNYT